MDTRGHYFLSKETVSVNYIQIFIFFWKYTFDWGLPMLPVYTILGMFLDRTVLWLPRAEGQGCRVWEVACLPRCGCEFSPSFA